MLEEMDGYRDWRAAASLGADIDTIRQDIMESVLPEEPEGAVPRQALTPSPSDGSPAWY